MNKKSLIVYASKTGNTEKVALRFKSTFEKNGWTCDIFKVAPETDFAHLPFDYNNYDFLCLGSPDKYKDPVDEIATLLKPPAHTPRPPRPADAGPSPVPSIKFGPDARKGIVFATFGGLYYGPNEIEPVLSFMKICMEMYLKFKCVGQFACPGKYPAHLGWYKNLSERPSERDLMKAEIFLEETLEETYINGRDSL